MPSGGEARRSVLFLARRRLREPPQSVELKAREGAPLFEEPAQRAEQKDGGGTEGETGATSTAPRPEMERSPSHSRVR